MCNMFTPVHFQDNFQTVFKPAAFSFVSTTTLLVVLHFINAIKTIGYLQSLYIPVIITCLDIVKNVIFTGLPTINGSKQTKWTVLKALVLIFISIVSFFILAILYGAKAFSEHEQTLMFSIFMTVCTTIHCIINMGYKDFNTMLTKQSNTQELMLNSSQVVAICSIIGCWSSAIVIPLDWDRWWQQWPIPSIMGCLLGYNLGFVVIILLSYMNVQTNLHKRKRQV